MALYSYRDYECTKCGAQWEDFVDQTDLSSECPHCGEKNKPVLSAANIGAFSARSAEHRSEVLSKRSAEHSIKELRKEPEKWGEEGIRRARAGQIRSK